MNRSEAHMAAAKYLAQNAAMKSQIRWFRKMLREFVWLYQHESPNDLGSFTEIQRHEWVMRRDAAIATVLRNLKYRARKK